MKLTLTLAASALLSVGLSSAFAESHSAGDAAAGEAVFRKCAACHNVETDKNKVGPHLMNLMGRQPGSLEGFRYSGGMVEFGEGKVWDAETLTPYLENPRGVVKGTRMAFAGLKKPEDVANVIAYLQTFSEEMEKAQ